MILNWINWSKVTVKNYFQKFDSSLLTSVSQKSPFIALNELITYLYGAVKKTVILSWHVE